MFQAFAIIEVIDYSEKVSSYCTKKNQNSFFSVAEAQLEIQVGTSELKKKLRTDGAAKWTN